MTCCLKLFSSFFVCDQLLVAACDWWEVLAVTLTDCICVCAEKDNKSKYFPLAVMTDIWLCLFCQSVCFACLCCLCKCASVCFFFQCCLLCIFHSFYAAKTRNFPLIFCSNRWLTALLSNLLWGLLSGSSVLDREQNDPRLVACRMVCNRAVVTGRQNTKHGDVFVFFSPNPIYSIGFRFCVSFSV